MIHKHTHRNILNARVKKGIQVLRDLLIDSFINNTLTKDSTVVAIGRFDTWLETEIGNQVQCEGCDYIDIMKKMGSEIFIKDGYIEAQSNGRLKGCEFHFDLVSVTATENINMFNLACVYILESTQKRDIMFVCGTLNGEYSKYSRGMIMYKNGGRKWLESNDFTIEPFGKQYYSNYANTSFYREYRVRINNITEFTVSPIPNQTNIDFGLKSGKLVQWTQEVVLQNLTGVRGILELVKSQLKFHKNRRPECAKQL